MKDLSRHIEDRLSLGTRPQENRQQILVGHSRWAVTEEFFPRFLTNSEAAERIAHTWTLALWNNLHTWDKGRPTTLV